MRKLAASREVGLTVDRGLPCGFERNPCGGDGDSVFVDHSDCGCSGGLGGGRADESERKEKSTHFGHTKYCMFGCGVERVGFQKRDIQVGY